MLLVIASIVDQHVTAGVAHWRALGRTAEIVTCHDLAQPGWQLTLDDEPQLVVAGRPVKAREVKGVITRLAAVTPLELPFIHIDDREYAAAEIQAFLLALLNDLLHRGCAVLNPATPGSLNGPPWAPEQWTQCAARAGVEVRPVASRSYAGGAVIDDAPPPQRRVVNVVGEACFGDPAPALRKAALAVAGAAATPLLRVAFDVRGGAPVFLDADPWVDVSDPEIAAAIAKQVAP